MTTYTIAIVEDDKTSQRQLQQYLERYQRENDCSFEVFVFDDGMGIVTDYEARYDVIFLDVQMQLLDGLSAAHRIRKLDPDVILIFITNMAQFAIKGYEVDALSYLLKPVPYFSFSQELMRSLKRVDSREKHYLLVPVDSGMKRLNVEKIFYIERDRHRIKIHTEPAVHSMVGTVKDATGELSGKGFVLCNSGYLVNLRHVTGIDDNRAVIANGYAKLSISRPRRTAFLQALTDYVGGGL